MRFLRLIYFLEDDTAQIFEDRVANSGIPQGKFLQRQRVPLPTAMHGPKASSGSGLGTATIQSLGSGGGTASGNYLHWTHLYVGQELALLGRTFKVYGADDFTRRFYAEHAKPLAPNQRVPVDKYSAEREAFMKRETGGELGVWRGKRMSPVKRFMEATRGNANPRLTRGVPDSLGQFLKYDGVILRFKGLWDDTDKVYGQKHYVNVRYHLADDTVEVLEEKTANDGSEPWKAIYKRAPLPLDDTFQDARSRDIEDDVGKDSYVTWRHPSLRVGQFLNVMSRPVFLYAADDATHKWMAENAGVDMRAAQEAVAVDVEEEDAGVIEVEPPPYDEFRFGTEEDSLSSFFSLVPKVPRKDAAKMAEHDGRMLRFTARLAPVEGKPVSRIDATRSFTITFYMATDEVSIYEPPRRNAGIAGGKFLLRTKKRNPATGDFFRPKDLAVGSVVNINGFNFLLEAADAKTRRLLGGKAAYADADAGEVVERLRAVFEEVGMPSGKVFQAVDRDYSGCISIDELEAALVGWDIPISRPELVALFRAFDKEHGGTRLLRPAFAQLFPPALRAAAPQRDASVDEPGSSTTALRAGTVAGVGAAGEAAEAAGSGSKALLLPPDDVAAVAEYGEHIAAHASKLSESQEAILAEIMALMKRGYLSQSCERILASTFASYDSGSDGLVTRSEFRTVLAHVFHLGPRQIAVLEARFFPDDMKVLNYKAFMTVLARSIGRFASLKEVV